MNDIPKKHKLLDIFSDVGSLYSLEYVLDYTEISTIKSLKTVLWELRKKGIVDIRMKFGMVKRIK